MDSDQKETGNSIIHNKWKIKMKIGKGSFGEIFLAADLETGKEYAVKAESTEYENPQLVLENHVYQALQGSEGIPTVQWFGTHNHHYCMVMDLLGPSLEELYNYCDRKLSLVSILMVAEQLVARVQSLHEANYIHRDIKPDNFLIGLGKSTKFVHMIDLGLAKKYRSSRTGKHIPYIEGKGLTGTARYASINTHLGIETSRRDDLESIGYCLIYLANGRLPWQGLPGRTKSEKYARIQESKTRTPISKLCEGLPDEFAEYLRYVRNLRFDETPDYTFMRNLFKHALDKQGNDVDREFTWTIKKRNRLQAMQKRKEKEKKNKDKGKEKDKEKSKSKRHSSQSRSRRTSTLDKELKKLDLSGTRDNDRERDYEYEHERDRDVSRKRTGGTTSRSRRKSKRDSSTPPVGLSSRGRGERERDRRTKSRGHFNTTVSSDSSSSFDIDLDLDLDLRRKGRGSQRTRDTKQSHMLSDSEEDNFHPDVRTPIRKVKRTLSMMPSRPTLTSSSFNQSATAGTVTPSQNGMVRSLSRADMLNIDLDLDGDISSTKYSFNHSRSGHMSARSKSRSHSKSHHRRFSSSHLQYDPSQQQQQPPILTLQPSLTQRHASKSRPTTGQSRFRRKRPSAIVASDSPDFEMGLREIQTATYNRSGSNL